jgi:hypothetical protein
VEDLAINSAEDSIAKNFLSQILHVSIITKSDVLLQAIIQGFSTALSGSPLGIEVDVRKLPPRSWNVRFASTISILSTPKKQKKKNHPHVSTPVGSYESSFWADMNEEEENLQQQQKRKSSVDDGLNEHDNGHQHVERNDQSVKTSISVPNSVEQSHCNMKENEEEKEEKDAEGSEVEDIKEEDIHRESELSCRLSDASVVPTQQVDILDLSHYSAAARLRAQTKAKESYVMYGNEHYTSPDYGIAIEMAFSTLNDEDSCKLKEHKRRRQLLQISCGAYKNNNINNNNKKNKKKKEEEEEEEEGDAIYGEYFTFSEIWQDSHSSGTDGGDSGDGGCVKENREVFAAREGAGGQDLADMQVCL